MDPAGGLAFGVGLVFLAIVVQTVGAGAARGTIDRNSAVGIRTRATQSSDAAWRAGHRAAAPWLLASAVTAGGAGAVTLVLSAVLLASGGDNAAVLVLPLAGLIVSMVVLVLAARAANASARSAGADD